MVMPAFNQEVLMSYWPLIVLLALFEIGVGLYKWIERQWTMKLVTINAVRNVFSSIVLLVMVTNPALIHDAVIPYMASLLEISNSSVHNFLEWAVWTVFVVVIVTTVLETYDSYRKAKSR